MRILQIHNRYRQDGGEDVVVANEAALLRSAGHEVIQYEVRNSEGSLQAVAKLGLSAWNPFAAHKVSSLVERHCPDVTHVHNTWYELSTSVFAAIRSAGSPLALTLHNYRSICANALLLRDGSPCRLCPDTNSSLPAIRHRCYRDSLVASTAAATAIATSKRLNVWETGPDLLMAVSASQRDILIHGGLPADKMIVKHHFAADPGPRQRPPSDSNTVLYVGRLSREKGIDVLLEAWKAAGRGQQQLEVIGEGESYEQPGTAPGPQVRFLGRIDAKLLQAKMLSARAIVVPSLCYETFGIVLIEAMAAGLPVIASDIGAIPEVLGTWPAELLVPPDSPEALAKALTCLGDDSLLDRVGYKGRERYQDYFTPTIGLAALEAAYARAITAHA